MNELYRAEDGTLRQRGTPESNGTNENPLPYSDPHSGRKLFFWLYCIFLCIALGGALYTTFAEGSTVSETIDSIMPIAMILGSAVACLIYGHGGAKESGYHLGTFFAVTFWAALGAMAAFWGLSLLPAVLSVFSYIIIGIVAICIIAGIIGA